MKNLKLNFVIILFLITGSFAVKAQSNEFAPVGAKWHYNANPGIDLPQLYTIIESVKDTIVQGKNCRLLKQLFFQQKNVLSNDPERSYIVYSDSGTVYLWKDTAFVTLMNFNLNVGQSWRYKFKDGTSTELIVRKIDTITIGTQKRKVLQIRNFAESFSTIIEGIGSVNAFTPDEDYIGHQTRTEWIRCYQDSNIFYQRQKDISCDTVFTAGIEELNQGNKPGIIISPNPFQNQINIQLLNFPANPGFTNITVYSAEGKVVYETKSASAEITVPLSQLPQGMYHARIKNADTIIFKKLIKM